MPDFVFNEMRDSGNLLLNRLSTELAGMTGGKVRINSDLQIGNVGPQLATYCKQYHPFLTVIGAPPAIPDSRYSSDDAIEAVKRLPYPLLIVPKNAFFYGAPKLVVACDDVDIHSGLRTASPFLKELRETLGTRVEIVHVVQNGESVTTVLEDYVDLKKRLKDLGPGLNVVRQGGVVVGINDYLRRHPVDWMLVLPKKHSLLEFHKSRAREIGQHSSVPLLWLHE